MNRRSFLTLASMAALAACNRQPQDLPTRFVLPTGHKARSPLPDFYGEISDEPFPIDSIEEGTLSPEYWRQEVANLWPNRPRGSIIVDPDAALLYFVEGPETATRYGVSVGAAGFAWEGTARLQFCRSWPRWNVPEDTIQRRPELEPYSVANGGMDPGPDNPMGARALYLFQDGIDTLYRVHGGAKAREKGSAVSAGCMRLLNHDIIHLHARAVHGAEVTVFSSISPSGIGAIY